MMQTDLLFVKYADQHMWFVIDVFQHSQIHSHLVKLIVGATLTCVTQTLKYCCRRLEEHRDQLFGRCRTAVWASRHCGSWI